MTQKPLDETAAGAERAVLVGFLRGKATAEDAQLSLAELARLVSSAGGEVVEGQVIHLRVPSPATLISKGHLESLVAWAERLEADLVVLDDDMTPAQQRNLEKAFGRRVLTRTEIILDIFATHAKTRESMTQVELAQLRWRASRLIGASIATAKMGGASARIATRGPGETQLEVDRRRIRERVHRLEQSLKEIARQREIQRGKRRRSGLPLVGLVGYTNAGKSTLLNRLTQAGVLAEDRLFSTLDTTVRTLELPGGLEVGLIDTVGFVSKLPPDLVAAFRATLEEIQYADLILHVVDSTSPRLSAEFTATDEILKTLKCEGTVRLTVWNKIDLIEDPIEIHALSGRHAPAVAISALEGSGIGELLADMERLVLEQGHHAILLIPYDHYDLVARIHREGRVLETRDLPEGKLMRCRLAPHLATSFEQYELESWPEDTEITNDE